MPKINVDSAYFNHPKTRRLRIYCGPEADIFPIRLWAFCAEYFPKDGILRGYSKQEIEGILNFNGPSGNLINALLQVGFIELIGENYKVHDWYEHAGFIWNYKVAGMKGGIKSGKARRKTNRSDPSTPPRGEGSTRGSTIELNGIELNKDFIELRNTQTNKPVDKSVDNFKDQGKDKKPLTDVQKVVTAFKMLQGYPKEDQAWDKMYFPRFAKSAAQLLEFVGNWRDSVDCCQDVYEKLTSKGLTVTLETITKHAADWLKDKREREVGRGILYLPSNGSM